MALSKEKLFAGIGGGVFAVGVLALGYLLWDASSARSEAEEDLDSQRQAFADYNNAKVFPSKKSISSVKTNAAAYAAWREEACAWAARGDKTLPEESAAVFRQRLEKDVTALRALPGDVNGKIAAPDCLFGFEQFLGENGVLPQQADVPRLATQLDTIDHLVKLFSELGVSQVRDVKRVELAKKAAADEAETARPKKKDKKGAAEPAAETKHAEYAYTVQIAARPPALIKVINALATDTRFTVVTSFSFTEDANNMVDKALDAREAAKAAKDQPQASGGRRRRRRGAEAQEETKPEEKKDDRLVVDPASEMPLVVDLALTVHDFGRAAAQSAASAGAAPVAPAGDAKAGAVKEGK